MTRTSILASLTCLTLMMGGCKKDGEASNPPSETEEEFEEAGEDIEEAAEQTGDAFEEGVEEVGEDMEEAADDDGIE